MTPEEQLAAKDIEMIDLRAKIALLKHTLVAKNASIALYEKLAVEVDAGCYLIEHGCKHGPDCECCWCGFRKLVTEALAACRAGGGSEWFRAWGGIVSGRIVFNVEAPDSAGEPETKIALARSS